jgi:hypothetical protein
MPNLKRRPSPALVVALVALFVGLGGGAYAAKKIGTKNIKNSAVTGKKIANNAVTSKKIKSGEVKGKDLGKGIIYDYGPPVGGNSAATSEDKTFTAECPNGQVPVTGGVRIQGADFVPNPAPRSIAITESGPHFPPSTYPGQGWVASAIEVNGGT